MLLRCPFKLRSATGAECYEHPPVGEELGEVLLVIGHARLLGEEDDQQQLQEWQVVDSLAVSRTFAISFPP